jgi:polo-like kinase 1
MENFQTVTEKKILKDGTVKVINYQKGKFLGKGGFAKVYEFQREGDTEIVAGKVVEKESLKKSRARQKLMSEIKIHRSIRHENVV